MFKVKKHLLLLMLMLTVFLSSLSIAWASDPIFKDLTGSHWAREGVEEMNAAGVIAGYTDGTFKPDSPVTRLQTVVMLVRIFNLQSQADTYDTSTCKYDFPSDISNGTKGYFAVAVDKGWLVSSGLQEMKANLPATRQEVAGMIAVALNLSGDYSKLTFTDKGKISSALRNYVAGVYEAGLMKGKSDKIFDPLSNVKRSEIASVFDRMTDLGKVSPNPTKKVEGYLEKFDATSKQLTIRKDSSLTYTYSLDQKAAIYNSNKVSDISDLKANQAIRLYLNKDNKICFIKTISSLTSTPTVTPPVVSTNAELYGEIKDLTSLSLIKIETTDGTNKSYSLDSNVKVYDADNQATSLLSLSSNSFIKLVLVNNIVTQIYLQKSNTIEGNIYSISSNKISITNKTQNYSYTVDKSHLTVLDQDGYSYDYDDLEDGYKVEISYSSNNAFKIELISTTNSSDVNSGIIYNLQNAQNDDDDWSVTLLDENGYRKTYDVNSGVNVYDQDGDRISFWNLTASNRDDAVLSLDSNGDVTKIELTDSYEGIITELDSDQIKIGSKTYDLSNDLDIDDYLIGSKVKVYISDDEVQKIEVIENEDDITVPGYVYDVDDDDNKITIKQDSGNKFTFDVDNHVDIYDDVDDNDYDLEDLRNGWEVKLDLNNNEVDQITIKDK